MADIAERLPATDALRAPAAAQATRTGALARFATWPLHQRFLAALTILYVAKALIFVFVFPPFSGHDETAHYSYIRTVVDEHRVPELIRRDLPANTTENPYVDLLPAELYQYCRYTLQWFCSTNPDFAETSVRVSRWSGYGPGGGMGYQAEGVQYAANHPPLYYLTMAPVYWLSERAGASVETQLYLLRLMAIPFGLIVVLLAYLTTRLVFPRDPFLLITVPAFVALQTQVSYEATMVNNDIMSIAAYSWVLYLVIRAVRDGFTTRNSLLIGFALGLGMLTKSTSVTAAAIIGVALLTALAWSSRTAFFASLPSVFRSGLTIAAPAVILAGPWYLFMWQTYGNFTALPQVLQLQGFWNQPLGSFPELLFNIDFFKARFSELWGEFGWRVLPLDPTLMRILGVFTLVCVAGLVAWVAGWKRHVGLADQVANPGRRQAIILAILLVSCIVGYLATVQFGTQFALTQARYFFPVINAFAILLMIGYRTVIPRRWLPVGAATMIVGLIALNVLVVTSYVIPYYWL